MDLPYHLLIVDDDELTTDTLARWFEFQVDEKNRKRWNVSKTYSAVEAVELIKSRHFDAIIMDLKLPEFDGFEILKRARMELISTSIVVLTAYQNMLSFEDSMKLGVFGYFQKPLIDNNQIELCLIRGIQTRGLEKALIESAALCKLSREISHDAKNYLTPLLGFAELLEFSLESNDEYSDEIEYVRHIISAASAVKVLSNELLQFSNQLLNSKLLKSGKNTIHLREINDIPSPGMNMSVDEVDVNAVLSRLISEFSSLYAKQVIFYNKLNDLGFIKVQGNEFQLDRVFRNIMTNAIEAMQGTKSEIDNEIEISTYRENGSLKIRFSDNGPGISNEDLEKIFHPFFTTKEKGTGMGLYISERLLKLYGGKIDINSKEGIGTQVLVDMPIFN